MKTVCLAILFAACTVMTTAQVRKIGDREVYRSGDIELGISTNLGINDKKTTGYYYSGYQEREFYLSLGAYGGYYLFDGLSIGPELGINFSMSGTTYLIGNLCYIFNSKSRSFYPYVKAGYGVTDVKSNWDEQTGLFESLNYSLINLGIGIKYLQSSSLAFNIELNYKHISGSESQSDYYYSPYTGTSDIKLQTLSFSFGSSLAL